MATKQEQDLEFDRMAAVHRGAKRTFGLYAALLVLIGIALIVGAVTGHVSWLIGLVTGAMAIAVAIIPIRQVIERSERIEGLTVLEDEWRELVSLGDAAASEREQFLALMRRLYA